MESSAAVERERERRWKREDDLSFEAAVVRVPDGTADRWRRIAEEVSGGGKYSAEEVEKHYDALVDDVLAICSGFIPLPEYPDEQTPVAAPERKVDTVIRKKGKAWSPQEHMLFLQGLEIYGKGDWRSISRNSVKTKTATQVASHAQKYYKRIEAKNKGRRTSIHDITLDDSNPTALSNSMQNTFEGGSLGYDNATNVNYNQEGLLVHDSSNTTSPHPQFPNAEAHFQSHSSMEETSNPYYLSSPSSGFINHGRVNGNGHPSNMYYQGGLSGCNITPLNQFPMANNGNTIDTNSHLISPQSQFSPKGGPINMISHSTPPPFHLQNMNNHMGHQLPNYRTIHMPHRSLYMGNDGTTRVVPNVGLPDNRVKANGADRFTYMPDQSPNGPNQTSF